MWMPQGGQRNVGRALRPLKKASVENPQTTLLQIYLKIYCQGLSDDIVDNHNIDTGSD
jgi:hypothetical protein